MILASEKSIYDRYARNIRKEYIHVPLELYKKGRAAVLTNFIKNDAFVTETFNKEYAALAKENMEREIGWLPNLEE